MVRSNQAFQRCLVLEGTIWCRGAIQTIPLLELMKGKNFAPFPDIFALKILPLPSFICFENFCPLPRFICFENFAPFPDIFALKFLPPSQICLVLHRRHTCLGCVAATKVFLGASVRGPAAIKVFTSRD